MTKELSFVSLYNRKTILLLPQSMKVRNNFKSYYMLVPRNEEKNKDDFFIYFYHFNIKQTLSKSYFKIHSFSSKKFSSNTASMDKVFFQKKTCSLISYCFPYYNICQQHFLITLSIFWKVRLNMISIHYWKQSLFKGDFLEEK